MKFRSFLLLVLLLVSAVFQSFSQTYNDGPVQLQINVSHVYNQYYDDVVSDAENTWKVYARDDADLDGADWVGGNCIEYTVCSSCAPFTSPYNGTNIFNHTYTTTVPSLFDLYIEAWEDDCGDQCTYDSGVSCFGDNDDRHCGPGEFASNIDYRVGNPCEWYTHPMMYACGTDYGAQVETFWRYTSGTSCNDAIYLGEVTSGASFSHFNSNVCYSNNFDSPLGYSGNDVFYSFNISQPTGVDIDVCFTNYNLRFILLDDACNVVLRDSTNCSDAVWLCNTGYYTVVVDAMTPLDAGTFTLHVAENPNIALQEQQIAQTDLSCYGSNDGFILAQYQGGNQPLTYTWSNGASSSNLVNLPAGTYDVTVTDKLGCSLTHSFTLTEPAEITTTTNSSNAANNNSNDGTAVVIPNNGVQPYTYMWSNGGTDAAIVGLDGGLMYYVTVTDANGCAALDSAYVGLDDTTTYVNQVIGDMSFTLYPNPANQTAYLKVNSKSSHQMHIEVVDMYMQSILKLDEQINGDKIQSLDISKVPAGIYEIEISIDNGDKLVKHLVVQ